MVKGYLNIPMAIPMKDNGLKMKSKASVSKYMKMDAVTKVSG